MLIRMIEATNPFRDDLLSHNQLFKASYRSFKSLILYKILHGKEERKNFHLTQQDKSCKKLGNPRELRKKKLLSFLHVVPLAWISLTLSRHSSLSFIASGMSSGLHPVSSHNCCMYVRACRPAFAQPYVGVHRSTSLMSSSLLLQQCPACLVRLTWIVFVMGCRWPYSWCLVGCCRQDLFKIARSIVV